MTYRPRRLVYSKYYGHDQVRSSTGDNSSITEFANILADLLIIGVGKSNMPLSPQTRQHIAKLGLRVEVLDTRNAAAQFNLLATERGVSEVAAALIPIGWEEGVGAK